MPAPWCRYRLASDEDYFYAYTFSRWGEPGAWTTPSRIVRAASVRDWLGRGWL